MDQKQKNHHYRQHDQLFLASCAICMKLNKKRNFLLIGTYKNLNQENLMIVDLNNYQKVTLKGHHMNVTTVECLNSGKHCYSGGEDRTIKVWMINKQQNWVLNQSFDNHNVDVKSIKINQSETELFSLDMRTNLILWQIQKSGQLQLKQQLNFVIQNKNYYTSNKTMDICRDSILAFCDQTSQIQIWKLKEDIWQEDQLLKNGVETINVLLFHQNSGSLISGGRNNQIKIWEVDNQNQYYVKHRILNMLKMILSLEINQNQQFTELFTSFQQEVYHFKWNEISQEWKQKQEIKQDGIIQGIIQFNDLMIINSGFTIKFLKNQVAKQN